VITGQVQVQLANQAVSESFDQVKQGIDVFSASAVVAANQALELAGKLKGLAVDMLAAAEAGAAALDISKSFSALGDAAPGIDALRDSVAGVVDDTALQRFAVLNAEMELSAETTTGLAQRVTVLAEEQGKLAEVSDILAQAVESPKEAFKKLGVIIDDTEGQYAGLSEAQKNLLIIQEQANKGTQEQVDAMDSASAAVLRQKTSLDNLVSSVQQGIASWLQSSGALDAVGEAIEGVQEFLTEHAEELERIGAIAFRLAGVLGDVLAGAWGVVSVALDVALPIIEGVVGAFEEVAFVVREVGEFLGGDFADMLHEVFIEDMPWAESNVKSVNDVLVEFREELEAAERAARDLEEAEIVSGDLIEQGVAIQQELAMMYEENRGNVDDIARSLVSQLGSEEAALDLLSSKRETLEGSLDVLRDIDKQTASTLEWELFLNRDKLGLLEAITAEILTQNALDLERAEAEKEAEKRREEARRRAKAAREEQRKFEEDLLSEALIAQEQEVQEAFRMQLAGIEARNDLLNVGTAIMDVVLEQQQLQLEVTERAWEADVRAIENMERKNQLLEEAARHQESLTSSVRSGLVALGEMSAGAGDDMGLLVDMTATLAQAFKESSEASDLFDASLQATRTFTSGLIDDKAQRALFEGIFETAEAARDAANLNFIGAAGHGFAATTYFAAAAMGGKGGGGGRGDRGAGAGTGPAPAPAGFGPSLATEPADTGQQGPGTSIYVQYVSPASRGDLGPMLNSLNELGRSGAGVKIDASLIEGLGG
jgi:hypothetical protein